MPFNDMLRRIPQIGSINSRGNFSYFPFLFCFCNLIRYAFVRGRKNDFFIKINGICHWKFFDYQYYLFAKLGIFSIIYSISKKFFYFVYFYLGESKETSPICHKFTHNFSIFYLLFALPVRAFISIEKFYHQTLYTS